MPKISVIVPVYNTEQYLAKCLDSLCNQTLEGIEIICIDDCSSDNSYALLKEYASKFNNIKIIKHLENKGESGARNSGLAAATGEYIGFVDSDDWVDLNFYEKLYALAKNNNNEIAKANLVYVYSDGTKKYAPGNSEIKHFKNKFLFYYDFYSAIYKATLLKKHDIKFTLGIRIGPDILFLSEVVSVCKSISVMDSPNYYYQLGRADSALNKSFSVQDIESLIMIRLRIMENIENSKEDFKNFYDYLLRVHIDVFFGMRPRCVSEEQIRACARAVLIFYNKALNKEELDKIITKENALLGSIFKQQDAQLMYEFFVNNVK